MELTNLRYFLLVAESGSLSRAAVRIGIAQPSLSRQIQRLEEELDARLFYRNGRGVSLTDAGIKLRDTATIFEMIRKTEGELRDTSRSPAGSSSLGVPPSIGATLGYPIARAFAQQLPSATLRIREGFSAILSEWIEHERLEAAVLYDAARNKSLNATPLLLEDLFLVQELSVDDDSDIGIEAIDGLPLVLPGPENGLRRVIDRALAKSGITPRIVMEVDSIPSLRQLAGGGLGATILPFGAFHREVRTRRLNARRILCPEMRALLVKVTPANKEVTNVTRTLLKIIDDEARKFVDSGVLRGKFGRLLRG